MNKFTTPQQIADFITEHTGLMDTEYKVHHMGTILPDGMYITLAHPLSIHHGIHAVCKTMQDRGYDVEYSDEYGPTAIICN
jgi:hypothetical protein